MRGVCVHRYVLQNDIPLDYQYYLDNQLSKPVLRLFEPLMNGV
jgi:DNA polymerase delta subunit 1